MRSRDEYMADWAEQDLDEAEKEADRFEAEWQAENEKRGKQR